MTYIVRWQEIRPPSVRAAIIEQARVDGQPEKRVPTFGPTRYSTHGTRHEAEARRARLVRDFGDSVVCCIVEQQPTPLVWQQPALADWPERGGRDFGVNTKTLRNAGASRS
jgi:hypothetical protein